MIRRGEIWWAELPSPRGSEPGCRRPVVVVSSDAFNESGIRTVLAAILTSNLALAAAPGNLELSAEQSGLPRDSVVNVSQLVTLDKRYLSTRVGSLGASSRAALDAGLRLALSLA